MRPTDETELAELIARESSPLYADDWIASHTDTWAGGLVMGLMEIGVMAWGYTTDGATAAVITFAALFTIVSVVSGALLLVGMRRSAQLVETRPPSLDVESHLQGTDIVREIRVGSTKWEERVPLDLRDEGAIAVAAAHRIEDARILAALREGHLSEVDSDVRERRMTVEALLSTPANELETIAGDDRLSAPRT